jgi:hypothetical protein
MNLINPEEVVMEEAAVTPIKGGEEKEAGSTPREENPDKQIEKSRRQPC